MNSHTVFQINIITKLAKYMDENFLLKNKRAYSNQTWHNAFLDKGYSSHAIFQGETIATTTKINKIRNLIIFFSKTTRAISIELGTKHPLGGGD